MTTATPHAADEVSAGCGGVRATIRLFGSIAVEHDGRTRGPSDFGGSRPKQVLEILLAARGGPVAVERADIDLDRFDRLLARAGRASTESARRCLTDALSLATAEVLEDEPYADWAEELRGTYRGRVIGANLEAADGAHASGCARGEEELSGMARDRACFGVHAGVAADGVSRSSACAGSR